MIINIMVDFLFLYKTMFKLGSYSHKKMTIDVILPFFPSFTDCSPPL